MPSRLPTPTSTPRAGGAISIIIPTLNEESDLPETLASISQQNHAPEIIVADGGSTDRTVALAEAAHCRVVRCPNPGRAHQMNSGAADATGHIFLFLHADTHLSPGALSALMRAMEDPKLAGGGFSRRFRSPSAVLRLTAFLGSLRSQLSGLHFGDQAIFARRDAFERLGGFPNLPAFEDLAFSRRLRSAGKTRSLRPTIHSSARRFHPRGALAVSASDFWLTICFLLGADPNKLTGKPASTGGA